MWKRISGLASGIVSDYNDASDKNDASAFERFYSDLLLNNESPMPSMFRLSLLPCPIWLPCLLLCCHHSCVGADDIAQLTQRFIKAHCSDCHNSSTAEGGLDLSNLSGDLTHAQTFASWVRIHDRVQQGEMPPPDETELTPRDRSQFVSTIAQPLTAAHRERKGTVLRRLNAREYQNTLNDLFGTNLALAAMLPPDGRLHEFDNIGNSLNMSLVQLRQYIEAMELVLDTSISKTIAAPEPSLIKTNYAETSEGERFIGDKWLKLADGAVVFYQNFGYPTGMLRTANTRRPGWYNIRVQGYAHQSEQPITFSVGATTFQAGLEKPTFGFFDMPPGPPSTIELTAWIEDRYMLEITPLRIYDEKYEIKNKGVENYTGPGLAILSVELEGPLVDQFPSRGHQLLFTGIKRQETPPRNPTEREKPWYQPKFEIVSDDPVADASQVLQRVAETAFRRPVAATQIAPYLKLFSAEFEQGANFEEALRTAVTAVFCSPNFLYFHEPGPQLNDDAIASRLSYFLNRSLTDKNLSTVAAAGKLTSNPQVLRSETERLLNSPHLQRFVVDFTDAWLNLRDIEFTTPDQNLYPEYDRFLHDSMLRETRAYFNEQIQQNLPVSTIVKSDFAMLNNRLAELYEIEGVDGPAIRKVRLSGDQVRGGYLGQASILKVSANGTNTSPVVRGVWVLERIMGQHAPPPPPGIPGVEPDIRGATTLRDLLDKHRNSETCRACHELIDPPGFALENFNPVGGWQTHFRSIGNGERVNLIVHGRKVNYRVGPAVDASGEFQNGETFSGFQEFREILATREEMLTRSFVTKLLTFACGREMGFSDRQEIDDMVQAALSHRHGIRELIHDVVQSEIFRSK